MDSADESDAGPAEATEYDAGLCIDGTSVTIHHGIICPCDQVDEASLPGVNQQQLFDALAVMVGGKQHARQLGRAQLAVDRAEACLNKLDYAIACASAKLAARAMAYLEYSHTSTILVSVFANPLPWVKAFVGSDKFISHRRFFVRFLLPRSGLPSEKSVKTNSKRQFYNFSRCKKSIAE